MKKSKKKDKFDNKYFTRKLEMQVIQPGDGRNLYKTEKISKIDHLR